MVTTTPAYPGRRRVTAEERIRKLLEDFETWERAYRNAAAATRIGQMTVPRKGARPRKVRDHPPELASQNQQGARTTFRSVRQSQAAFRMARRQEVLSADERDRESTDTAVTEEVAEAWSDFRRLTLKLVGYGELLERVTGIPRSTLRRLATSELPDQAVARAPRPTGDAMLGIYGAGRLPDPKRGGADLPSKQTVKSFQGVLARLAREHSRAQFRLEQAAARRGAALAAHDKAVAAAQFEVDRAVVEMANALGPELTASVLEMRLTDVRRLVKTIEEGDRVCD